MIPALMEWLALGASSAGLGRHHFCNSESD
jgi:hypothetical protein